MKETIFIVDDSVLTLSRAEQTLSDYYDIVAVESAQDMFASLETITPAIILLDVEMPRVNGFDALAGLKSDPRFAHIPVILLTALNNTETELKGFKLGAVDFITKPFSSQILLNRIQLHIDTDKLIKQRTASLEKAHLELEDARQQAIKSAVAEESNKAKSKFLARISHEIRTPISAIMGISEIQLQNPDLPHFVDESFARINTSSHMLLGIINDLLDLSKVEAGKMEIFEEAYSIESIVNNIANLHSTFIGNKPIDFCMYIDRNLPTLLKGDSLRIAQIVSNLLTNAFKYTDAGTVEFSIRCIESLHQDYDTTLVISVLDTGLGMTQSQLNLLQGEYTRFHEHENRDIVGTGLGMSIVNNLMTMMNGHIDIASAKGEGTTVVVYIPQRIIDPQPIGSANAKKLQEFEISARAYTTKFNFEPEPMPYGKVLVVDDIQSNLYVAQGLLEFYQLTIETCESGEKAIEKIDAGHVYDIIFMDHMMPGIDGLEAMKILRGKGYHHPIIALTANAIVEQADAFINEGFDAFLSKPIRTSELNALLLKYVKNAAPPTALRELENYQNDPALLKKLRADFVRDHKNSFTAIKVAIQAEEIPAATLLAHSIKGLAGLIQEPNLAQAAADAETIFEVGAIPSDTILGTLEKEMNRVIQAIGEAPTPPKYKPLDKLAVGALFDELSVMLKHRSPDCQALIPQLNDIPQAAIVARQIEDFEFSLALSNIGTLRRVLDV